MPDPTPVPNKDPGQQPGSLGLGDVQNVGDALGKIGASQQVVAIFEIAAGVVLLLTGAGAVVGVSVITLGLLGLFAKTDDIASVVQKLVADFDILFGELQAEADVALMRSVGDKIDTARTTLRTLRMSPNDPSLREPNGAVLFNSSLEVESLGDITFYLRPFFPAAAYSDPWSGRIDPPPFPHATSSTIVFDYRLTLPAFLEAIVIRLVILAVLVPNFRQSDQPELKEKMADRVEALYLTIRDGIIPIRKPNVNDVLATKVFDVNDGRLLRIEPSAWDKAGRLYGAVERYSAVSVVDQYRSDRFLPDPQSAFLVSSEAPFGERDNPSPPPLPVAQIPAPAALAPFLLEYAVGILARSKAVYNVLGLRKLKATVDLLKDLAGEPRLAASADGDWSLREIDGLMGTILFSRPSTADGVNAPIRVASLFAQLESTLFEASPPLVPVLTRPASLRQILDKVALQN